MRCMCMKYSMKESISLEFKEKTTNNIFKTISAFANYNDGRILVGIADDGSIIGVDDAQKAKLSLENAINDNIIPRPDFELNEISMEGKPVIEINIRKGRNVPYLYKGDAYRRIDTSTIKINENELFDLLLKKKNITYDSTESNHSDITFHMLEDALLEQLKLTTVDINILISLGLYKDGKYTIAAELLSDQNTVPSSFIDIARFGSTNSIFLNRIRYDNCSILKQYQETINMFQLFYKPFEVVEGFQRVTKVKIPEEAFREAVANAIVHRDYLIGGGIQISMYESRIEISSPGGLPHGITVDNYLNDIVSIPRNPVLASIFYRLGIIELFGTGIRRIKDAYIGSMLAPGFFIDESRIRIVLPVIHFSDNISDEEKLMNHLFVSSEVDRHEAEKLLGLTKSQTIAVINKLLEKERIVRIGSGPGTRYRLK
ncbi:MAG: RNA-binding domain-containing protein [Saccharofermentanales bacterium]